MASKTEMENAVEVKRAELEKLTLNDLRKGEGTELNIVGRHHMKKADLIQAILMAIASSNPEKIMDASTKEVTDNTEEVKEVKVKKKKRELTDVQKANKMRYIEEAEIGTIIAFKLPGMKVKSAKITRRSTKNKKFKVETTYGSEFVVAFDEVVWVKTNKRWPKGVYNLLKGIEEE